MEENNNQSAQNKTKKSTFLGFLLWDLPWKIIGILFASLFFSLLIEYIGIAFFWSEEGSNHSKTVFETEQGYFSEGFKRSLLLSNPVQTFNDWIAIAYEYLFIKSGFLDWINQSNTNVQSSNNMFAKSLNSISGSLLLNISEYLYATVYVTMILLIRVSIIALSIPLFILVIVVGSVDGLVRRDLRRYGAGYESSFVYHHSKRFIKPAIYLPIMIYLSWPFSVYPNLLILPGAVALGFVVSITVGSFKKYL